jgi:heme exporter protein A
MLEAIDLAFTRGERPLFSGLKLSLAGGYLLHVTGSNGSGKTSLLRVLCGLLPASSGEIRWNGESIKSRPLDFIRDTVYLGHLNGINDDLSAIENIEFSSTLAGLMVTANDLQKALRTMGIDSHARLLTQILSQGQKRRVALARLLITKSKFWLLDEPFAGLDEQATVLFRDIVASHLASGGIAVITSHHALEIAAHSVQALRLGSQ